MRNSCVEGIFYGYEPVRELSRNVYRNQLHHLSENDRSKTP
jgi:hypothetical protein